MDNLFNIGSFLMMLAMIGVVVFMGATGRLAAIVPPTLSRELDAIHEEVTTLKQDNEDLRIDNKGLHHTVRVLADQGAQMAHRLNQTDTELVTIKHERDLLVRRNAVLEAAFENRLSNQFTPEAPTAKLRDILTTLFSDNELRQLCADLKVDYESIEGEAKGDKAFNLVGYFERRGETTLLISALKQRRPNARL